MLSHGRKISVFSFCFAAGGESWVVPNGEVEITSSDSED